MSDVQRGTIEARRRKMFVWADELGLTREERIQMARFLLRRDITSWNQLDEDQVGRMLDALEGAHLVLALRLMRP
jgi:hypothetical protein